MIHIELFEIDYNTNSINVKASTLEGQTIDRAVLYHNSKFNTKEGIDISSLFSKNTSVSFNIPITILEDIKGIWFISLTDSIGQTALKVVQNFSQYYECILSKLLTLEVKGCEVISNNDCSDCNDLTLYTSTLLDTLEKSVQYKYYDEAFRLMKQLDELCTDCSSTPISIPNCNCK